MAIADDILALDGATGANGETLVLRHYFKFDEASSTFADSVGGRTGTKVGAGTLTYRAAGADENNTPTYAIDLNDNTGIDCGAISTLKNDIIGNGLCVSVVINHSAAVDRDPIVYSYNAAFNIGFMIQFNGLSSFPATVGSIGIRFNDGSSNHCQFQAARSDIMNDGKNHIWTFFLKAPGTIKVWCDGMPVAGTVTQTGTVTGAGFLGTDLLCVGCVSNGSSAPSTGTNDSFSGRMSHMFFMHGEPTQVQMRTLCRSLFYTVKGIPGVIQHIKPSDITCYTDPTGTIRCDEGEMVRRVRDLSPFNNHLIDQTNRGPTLEKTINADRWCLCFDNFTSKYYEWGERAKQQILACTGLSHSLAHHHMGTIAVVRTQGSNVRFKDDQRIIGFYDSSSGTYNHLIIYASGHQPALLRSSVQRLPANLPKTRCLPGLGILGFSTALNGITSSSGNWFMINNRFVASGSESADNGSTNALIRLDIGGPSRVTLVDGNGKSWSSGDGMWAGYFEESIVTRCGFTPVEASSFVAQTFTEAGEMIVPTYHVCVVGDSIAAGNDTSKCLSMLGAALPAAARRNTSWCNPSIGSMRIDDVNPGGSPAYDVSVSWLQGGLGSSLWTDPAAINIVAGECVVNDCSDGASGFANLLFSSGNNVLNPLTSPAKLGLIDQMTAAGFTKFYWNLPTDNAGEPGKSRATSGILSLYPSKIQKVITLTPLGTSATGNAVSGYIDGLHPNQRGMKIWANDWWGQAFEGELGSTGVNTGGVATVWSQRITLRGNKGTYAP